MLDVPDVPQLVLWAVSSLFRTGSGSQSIENHHTRQLDGSPSSRKHDINSRVRKGGQTRKQTNLVSSRSKSYNASSARSLKMLSSSNVLHSSANITTSSNSTFSNSATSDMPSSTKSPLPQHKHQIWLVTGPAGSGKSTVAAFLAKSLDYSYIEGDDYHPPANVAKMSTGTPLTDADRWDWLTVLREESVRRITAGSKGVVLTCSALKRKYRDVIRVAPYFHNDVQLRFIYLAATEKLLLARVAARQNHWMGANMVRSQFEALEPPTEDETDVYSVNVEQTMEEVMAEALFKVRQTI